MSLVALMILAGLIFSSPVVTFWFLMSNIKRLNQPKFMQAYGSLYSNMKCNKVGVVYAALFFFRRILLVASTFVLTSYPAVQLQISLWLSFGMFFYLIVMRPMNDRTAFIFEMLNEFILLCISYCLIPFGMSFFTEDTT